MNDGWDDLNITWLCGFYFINNNCYYYRVFNMIINIELIEIWLFKWPIIRTQDDQFYSMQCISFGKCLLYFV